MNELRLKSELRNLCRSLIIKEERFEKRLSIYHAVSERLTPNQIKQIQKKIGKLKCKIEHKHLQILPNKNLN